MTAELYDDLVVPLLPKQYDFVTCPDKWAGARGGFACGKTTSLFYWVWERLTEYPMALSAVAGPDYENLRRGFFYDFVAFLEQRGEEQGVTFRYISSPSPKIIFMETGAKLHALSAELRDKVHGIQLQTLVCEEVTRWNRGEEFYGDLAARLRHNETTARNYPEMQPQGRLVFNPPTTTHWLYDVVEKQWPALGYKCWQMSVRENFLMTGLDEYVENLRATRSPELWPSAIDGDWMRVGGNWYKGFDLEIHGRRRQSKDAWGVGVDEVVPLPTGFPPIELDHARPIDWALDFNVDPQASVIGQTWMQPSGPRNASWQATILYALDCIVLPDSTIDEVVAEFDKRYGDVARKVGVRLFGDATGRNRTQQSRSSNWDVVKRGLEERNIRYEMNVPNANPEIVDRRNAVMAQFQTGEGYGLLVDVERCAPLLTDFFEISEEPTPKFKRKNPKLTHVSDAFGYWVVKSRKGSIVVSSAW